VPSFPDPDARNVLLPGCARCPGLASCRERIAWGNGPLDAEVVVVGEAPAAGVEPPTEDAGNGDGPQDGESDADRWLGGNYTGMAYTSRHSGRRIRDLFADLGYEPYYTNAVKCFPQDPDDPTTNREPTPAERRRCGVHLRAEAEAVDPAAVVTTGKHATAAVLHLEGRTLDGFVDSVLEPVDCERLGATLLPILHPSYQDVWIGRLGYDPEGYRAAVDDALAALLG